MAYNYNNYHYNFSHLPQPPRFPYPGFQVRAPCLTTTGDDDDVLVMPHSPSIERLSNYDTESIDPEVEEAPAKDALISVSVKIIGRNEKRSEHKTFVLRDIDVKKIDNITSMKKQILNQFGSGFVNEDLDFNIGYYKGTTRIWIRTESDLTELLRIMQSKSLTLWCDRVDQQKRKKRSKLPASEGSSDSDNDQYSQTAKKKRKTASEDKDSRVDDTVDKLREKHGTKWSTIQYRVWAETMVGGRHTSYDRPPTGAYFKQSKGSQGTSTSPAVSGEDQEGAKSSAVMTPVKAAQLNSMYIKQIGELHSLLDLGAITSEDFLKQKNALMNNLH